MARRLSTFDFDAPVKEKEKNPLERFLDGKIYKFKKEDDFPDREMKSFRASLFQLAIRRDLKLRSRILDENTIVVQAIPANKAVKE